jgi:hypothetical protein
LAIGGISGNLPVKACPAGDADNADNDGMITVDEILATVKHALVVIGD